MFASLNSLEGNINSGDAQTNNSNDEVLHENRENILNKPWRCLSLKKHKFLYFMINYENLQEIFKKNQYFFQMVEKISQKIAHMKN